MRSYGVCPASCLAGHYGFCSTKIFTASAFMLRFLLALSELYPDDYLTTMAFCVGLVRRGSGCHGLLFIVSGMFRCILVWCLLMEMCSDWTTGPGRVGCFYHFSIFFLSFFTTTHLELFSSEGKASWPAHSIFSSVTSKLLHFPLA